MKKAEEEKVCYPKTKETAACGKAIRLVEERPENATMIPSLVTCEECKAKEPWKDVKPPKQKVFVLYGVNAKSGRVTTLPKPYSSVAAIVRDHPALYEERWQPTTTDREHLHCKVGEDAFFLSAEEVR